MGSKKLTEINKGDVQRLYKDRAGYSKSIARLVKNGNERFFALCPVI